MNRQLASYLFENEVLFTSDNIVMPEKEPVRTEIIKDQTVATEIVATVNPDHEIFKTSKSVLILVNSISNSQTELLSKILGAIKLTLNDVDLIDLSKKNIQSLESLINQGHSKKIINFGVASSKINYNLTQTKYTKTSQNSLLFLLCDGIEVVEKNEKDEKKLLWNALKDLFSI
jgi:hypothetical protein